ncbi:MAG: murein L,D-transpeptidase [Sphingobacteriales bacterium]|nr:MAG: murein L,D-transpeptidase [Sphingobacteriales bacterium]
MKIYCLLAGIFLIAFGSCTPPTTTGQRAKDSISAEPRPNMEALAPQPKDTLPQAIPPAMDIQYSYFLFKDSGRARMQAYTPAQRKVIYALNRVDGTSLSLLDTVLVPNQFPEDIRAISPFPQQVPGLRDIHKLVLFSYPIQAFAAYERGILQRWGPTSMGRKDKPTPEGLYFANWKAEETISTFEDEWEQNWTVNIETKAGIGWHQYALTGKPASHMGLRLLAADAQWLYDWVDTCMLESDTVVSAPGTPTLVFGQYPWGSRRPWMQLLSNPAANNLSAEQVQQLVQPHSTQIMNAQQKRTLATPASGNRTS